MPAVFNVTVIQPQGYVHSLALREAADYVHIALQCCGYQSLRTANWVKGGFYNIIFCSHLLNRGSISAIPMDSIIFNSEQLQDFEGWHFRSGVYRDILERFTVWDYSTRNLSHIPHNRKSFIPFLYCEGLKRYDLSRSEGRSLLFYGCLSQRRLLLISELQRCGIKVEVLFGEYSTQRDAKILRSWAVLNLHKTDTIRTFEPIRCFYPLINDIAVISEDVDDGSAETYRDSVFFFSHTSLVDGIRALYANQALFREQSTKMLAAFKTKTGLAEVVSAVNQVLRCPPTF